MTRIMIWDHGLTASASEGLYPCTECSRYAPICATQKGQRMRRQPSRGQLKSEPQQSQSEIASNLLIIYRNGRRLARQRQTDSRINANSAHYRKIAIATRRRRRVKAKVSLFPASAAGERAEGRKFGARKPVKRNTTKIFINMQILRVAEERPESAVEQRRRRKRRRILSKRMACGLASSERRNIRAEIFSSVRLANK